ncbi:MAG: arginine deiminase-related protein [Cyclobacteriaceae bacterium]|nr:arginine deiminase-related protein [Cyclobacteriaceae bacterium]
MAQSPRAVMMVSPDHFRYNHETAYSNAFQKDSLLCEGQHVHEKAITEFNNLVNLLRGHGIQVFVFPSPKGKETPDAVFPNNWVSFHEDGKVILYPMLTPNRRLERRIEIIEELKKSFFVSDIIDLTAEEKNGRILEGTGSIVFDRQNMMAYANTSARTDKHLFYDVVESMGYEGIHFRATDENGKDIYHTNVIMTIGDGYAVVCKEAIHHDDAGEIINTLKSGALEVVEISFAQMNSFAGNMIELRNRSGEKFLLMSTQAFNSLSEEQKATLSRFGQLIHADISTIETIGGGSVRCMIAGIHLPRK